MKGCLGCLGILLFSAMLVTVGTYIWRVRNPAEAADYDAREAKIDRENAARRARLARDPLAGDEFKMCKLLEDNVRDRLVAPSTADFESCVWHQPITYKGSGVYDGGFYVDAQNGFGAKIRSYWTGTVTETKDSPDPADRHFTYKIDSLEELPH
ncbi:MAG TPA: hypothetical protein VHT68_15735 [Pseudolabrys sp.]|jgi:hypothetical protein|nr:hypothetical protein [Pseudolabrys sp.]